MDIDKKGKDMFLRCNFCSAKAVKQECAVAKRVGEVVVNRKVDREIVSLANEQAGSDLSGVVVSTGMEEEAFYHRRY